MSELEHLKKSGWNWWAFLFGPLWYFYKGMLGKGALLLAVGLTGVFTFGITSVITWFYAGIEGNQDYYIHRKRLLKELEN